ncbi:SEC-C metal-binding domain-containing protein [Anaerovirgula multivorans]|uniref:SEC-C metal-binding domain-containing protein n=1 Tax=Anaerovirgula multivorans TaxID=312168 RepID=UPI000B777A28
MLCRINNIFAEIYCRRNDLCWCGSQNKYKYIHDVHKYIYYAIICKTIGTQ